MPVTAVPGFLLPFGRRRSLLGSSCARWGIEPSSRSAYRRVNTAGPQRGCRVAHEQDPTGQGAPLTPGTVVRSRPATILRPAPAAFQRPVPTTPLEHPIGGGHLHEASSEVHSRSPITPGRLAAAPDREAPRFPPVFSSPTAPGWNRSRFGFDPGLRTPRLPTTHAEAETGHRALARVLHLRHQPNLQPVPPTSLMHPHVAPSRRSPPAPPPAPRRRGPSPPRRYSGSLAIRTVSNRSPVSVIRTITDCGADADPSRRSAVLRTIRSQGPPRIGRREHPEHEPGSHEERRPRSFIASRTTSPPSRVG